MQIRPWRPEDRSYVMPMLLDYLAELREQGGDLDNCPQNAETLWGLGLIEARNGGPVLIAMDDGKELLAVARGFLLWTPVGNDTLKFRGRTLNGWGTYVKPSARGFGVSKQLREEAVRIAREKGYTRVVGTAHGEVGTMTGGLFGFRPYGIMGELVL